MAGPVRVTTMYPCCPCGTGRPSSSTTAVSTPGRGRDPHPGLKRVSVGRGERTVAPVSDCHQVSTMGTPAPPQARASRPIWVRAQVHASGLTASPTVPIRRMLDRSQPPCSGVGTPSGNQPISERISVGAV